MLCSARRTVHCAISRCQWCEIAGPFSIVPGMMQYKGSSDTAKGGAGGGQGTGRKVAAGNIVCMIKFWHTELL